MEMFKVPTATSQQPLVDEVDGAPLPIKTAMISDAVSRYGLQSVMDVGACWHVNGGYALHALAAGVKRAAILDGYVTRLTREKTRGDVRVSLHEGSLGDAAFVNSLPRCDAAIIYDVLLHQVDPHWPDFLARYAQRVDHFIIYNQDWTGEHTVRFPDFDLEWYVANVPEDREFASSWYAQHEQLCPWLGRKWRDAYHHWQWGITSTDIIATMHRLGFRLDWFNNFGRWSEQHPRIALNGYLFSRRR
jgi:hypothetical protein